MSDLPISRYAKGPVAQPQPPLDDCDECGLTLGRWDSYGLCADCQLLPERLIR